MRIDHGFDPVFDEYSCVLVLGSFPSVLSRTNSFYYGNPQNRFWRMAAACLGEEAPADGDIPAKRSLLLRHGLALWDVVASCEIEGSSDASIRDVVPVRIERVTAVAPIERVLCNGGTAARLYKRYLRERMGIDAVTLPSTSPANAAWSLDRLVARWGEELRPLA